MTSADGRAARWADHREARRVELAHIARRTVHREGPDISMEQIAAAAGTSKSVVYRYFADKAALQLAVAQLVAHDVEVAMAQALAQARPQRDGLAAMVDAYLAMIEASPNVYAFVSVGSPEARAASDRIADGLVVLLGEALADTDGPAAQTWGAGALGFIRAAGEHWLVHRGRPGVPDRTATAGRITDWLWAGLHRG